MKQEKENIIEGLIDNDLFVEWILNPTVELDDYWSQQISQDPDLEKYIPIVEKIIKTTYIDEPTLSSKETDVLWSNITGCTIDKSEKKSRIHKILFYLSTSAAVIAILLGGYWFANSYNKPSSIDYSAILADASSDLHSKKINLVTSDKRSLVIDDDSASLKYDNNGELSINSQKIKTAQSKGVNSNINQLVVPYGKIASMVLADGTKIWVNSGSRLLYPDVFENNKREIFVSGEAFLDVAKMDNAPFYIKTDKIDVKVVGTRFNVSAYPNDLQQSVVLVSGALKVKDNTKSHFNDVKPNQIFEYQTQSQTVSIYDTDVSNYTSWVDGYLLLKSESLDKVISRLSRHYNISFKYSLKDFQKIKISGKLELQNDWEDVLKYISVISPIQYEIRDSTVTVLAN